jgi:O-acetyl-ADP-ribose deacetylase (regulator of RNase III)
MRAATIDGRVLAIVRGDITRIATDAIVNAANAALAGGGGVDGAIHRAGGSAIMADLGARYGDRRRCPAGSAVVSVAGDLPARWVIHAVGPIWTGGERGEPELLAAAYRASLAHADVLGARRITFPAISCGIYGYPLRAGARVALGTVRDHLAAGLTAIERATFVLLTDETLTAFEAELERLMRS